MAETVSTRESKKRRKLMIISLILAGLILVGGIGYTLVANRTSPESPHVGFTSHDVRSLDGTPIHYESIGQGPGVLIVPGSNSLARDYDKLATALSKHFTVNVMDRRGHGASGPQGSDYNLTKEIEDVQAVQAQTKASYLFGHSFSGLVALEAIRSDLGIAKVAVYEPAISIDGSIRTDWIPAAKASVAAGKRAEAVVEFINGVSPRSAPSWMMRIILPLVIPKNERQVMEQLISETISEHVEVAKYDNTYQHFSDLKVPVLYLVGSKSAATAPANSSSKVAEVNPLIKAQELAGLDHFGPDETGPERVAEQLIAFFKK